ncbi:hypothetical protein Mp_6g00650 [Marchantia polymorpha subsp. ruderalis]|uniref:Uncharacterized protein n=2 Tax=Marchantia polymorpha TaxID=3197 RepID=A0AAF6BM50_MARPO|nr:hypothetical protein MARPO_0104s0001 [Marchantia polymorpha]BBN13084.1 hypothetical protein Mp_6g00650 [Marchantia polymorpha subsp. ruderalis]|eukprot:PTQ31961.1 hypothetical protein MARPO_0104s0001 [Marchantia polymorpha]
MRSANFSGTLLLHIMILIAQTTVIVIFFSHNLSSSATWRGAERTGSGRRTSARKICSHIIYFLTQPGEERKEPGRGDVDLHGGSGPRGRTVLIGTGADINRAGWAKARNGGLAWTNGFGRD